MLKISKRKVGDTIVLDLEYDPTERIFPIPTKFKTALNKDREAKKVFEELSPSRQKEINRYIGSLKGEEAIERNVDRVIQFLHGKARFVGRDKP
jgi:uncharacterized protein YdeI (YjbR/CyaY-like superfamily)